MFYILDLLGTMAFAISGVLTAINKKMDPFGVFVIALVTAVGGGTLRDVLIGRTPVGWMVDLNYVYMIVLGYTLAVIFRKKLEPFQGVAVPVRHHRIGRFYPHRDRERIANWLTSSYLRSAGHYDGLLRGGDKGYTVQRHTCNFS